MSVSACITSISGPVLLAEERAFLREAQPWGVILMGRSIVDRAQVKTLTAEIKDALGRSFRTPRQTCIKALSWISNALIWAQKVCFTASGSDPLPIAQPQKGSAQM